MSCETKKNIGLVPCVKMVEMPKGMIWTPSNFGLTAEEAADPAVWQAKLLLAPGARIFLFPEFDKCEYVGTEAAYDQSVLSDNIADMGKHAWRAMINQGLYVHKAMFTHRSKSGRIFLWDKANNLNGTKGVIDGKFKGYKVSLINPEKLKPGNGTEGSYSPIYVVLRDHLELDQHGHQIDGSFVSELAPIVDVTLSFVGAVAAGAFTMKAVLTADGVTPVVGLAEADIIVRTALGANQAKAITDNLDGTYLVDGTSDFVTGTVRLAAPSALTLKGYEAQNVLTLTIA